MDRTCKTTMVSRCPLSKPGRWMGAMLLVLSACASVSEQSAGRLDKQEIVAKLAQTRWDAVLKRDFETAYNLMSPASRSMVTFEDFRRKSGIVTWKAARIGKVECSADDLCAVWVTVKYSYQPRRGRVLENDHVVTETWRNTAGGWWYVSDAAR